MSRFVATKGKPGLDDRWVITPVGGADKLTVFFALMGGYNPPAVCILGMSHLL